MSIAHRDSPSYGDIYVADSTQGWHDVATYFSDSTVTVNVLNTQAFNNLKKHNLFSKLNHCHSTKSVKILNHYTPVCLFYSMWHTCNTDVASVRKLNKWVIQYVHSVLEIDLIGSHQIWWVLFILCTSNKFDTSQIWFSNQHEICKVSHVLILWSNKHFFGTNHEPEWCLYIIYIAKMVWLVRYLWHRLCIIGKCLRKCFLHIFFNKLRESCAWTKEYKHTVHLSSNVKGQVFKTVQHIKTYIWCILKYFGQQIYRQEWNGNTCPDIEATAGVLSKTATYVVLE